MLVDDVSFSVRGGEIYAIAGVQGNGQTEVTEALIGLTQPTSGQIKIAGQTVTELTTDEVLDIGVGYVPEDRLHDGLVGSFSVAQNLVLDIYDKAPFASRGSLNLGEIERNAKQRVAGVRRSPAGRRGGGGHAVRRQPAEGRAGARAVPPVEAADRGPADPRAGRGIDGVRPPPDRARAR